MPPGRGRGGRGRGEYYKNKYGRGGRGRGGRGGADQSVPVPGRGGGSYDKLLELLLQLDGKSYGAYHALDTSPQNGWVANKFTFFQERAQSDPFAAPTRCQIVIDRHGYPAELASNSIRRIAMADFILRHCYHCCQAMGADERLAGKGWSGPKGGDIQIMEPNQHVLEQSAVFFDSKTGQLKVQLTINLPARGRTILGRAAHDLFRSMVPRIVEEGLMYSSLDHHSLKSHVESVEDQAWLQGQLDSKNLVAFVPNGAILPRKSGVDDRPLSNGIPFQSPSRLELAFDLPNAKTQIKGMGVPKGVFLICGGGFHGKSTLLEALQVGVYPKLPGDGREFCVSSPQAFKVRAEDGRNIQEVDISSFINNLPFGKDTSCFSTPDASGSTSQASNIVEAIEVGANLFLIDEDTCATNFMFRDSKMMQLVPRKKEPITPFLHLVRNLYDTQGISTILVVGGVGDYLDVADTVVAMDSYHCLDVTEKAKQIVSQNGSALKVSDVSPESSVRAVRSRRLVGSQLSVNGKMKVTSQSTVIYGETELLVGGLEQIVGKAQTVAIANAMQRLSESESSRLSLREALEDLEGRMDALGLTALVPPGQYHGGMARPRRLELAGAVNRLRRKGCIQQIK